MGDQIPIQPFISCGTWVSKSPTLHLSFLIHKMVWIKNGHFIKVLGRKYMEGT